MSSSVARPLHAMAAKVWFDDSMMHVRLVDGREIGVPIEWYPALRDASDTQRENWRLVGDGIGIHWDDLDEDLSVARLMEP